MRYLYSLLFIPVLVACSDTVDLFVSGNGNTGIVFELSKSDAKKLDSGFTFYVMDNSAVPAGTLKETAWEIKISREISWFNFKNDYTYKWTYGVKPSEFNETVKPKQLQENTQYYYSIDGGRSYHGSGCFYLNENKMVMDNKSC
ncbi:hypothetical protein EXE30_01090 [Acinetobacter halotolerans]|uniref:Lipoprotein n=1 Tax=Acinetobacter halotolerans TaxID=1752076 RepID=A0A4Q6XKA1_9GAMM|nr:hypothetical protein [Acinetobacter halotolerans]RZF56882.1 hypothetical protein EXE30_01090 [Acinetobacter halotolerans]